MNAVSAGADQGLVVQPSRGGTGCPTVAQTDDSPNAAASGSDGDTRRSRTRYCIEYRDASAWSQGLDVLRQDLSFASAWSKIGFEPTRMVADGRMPPVWAGHRCQRLFAGEASHAC